MEYTGERLIPELGQGNIKAHQDFYNMVLPVCFNKKVLDIACGTGWACRFLDGVSSSYTGVDISEEALVWAKENYEVQGFGKFLQGSIADIPFIPQTFDVVLSIETFEHVDHIIAEKMVTECYRVLRPKGIYAFSTPKGETFPYHPKSKEEEVGYHKWHYTKGELQDLTEMFDRVHFNEIHETYIVYCYKD